MFQTVIFAAVVSEAIAAPPRTFAKGYVRRTRSKLESTVVAQISQSARQNAPQALDWSTKGAITPVKDQGGCGDCWAFATTEGVESAVFMATGELVALSEQQLTACDKDDNGCQGGDPSGGLDYIKNSGGIDTQKHYADSSPATAQTGNCTWSGAKAAEVTSWSYAVPPCLADGASCNSQDEDGLAAALAQHGPLTICINAGPWNNSASWTTDKVYTENCTNKADDLDHCVQLVGYNKTASPPYWKIRNTWTASWGEKGFLRLPYGINACGLANEAFIINVTALSDPNGTTTTTTTASTATPTTTVPTKSTTTLTAAKNATDASTLNSIVI